MGASVYVVGASVYVVAHKIFSVSPSPLLGSLGLELGLDWGLEGWGLGLDNLKAIIPLDQIVANCNKK